MSTAIRSSLTDHSTLDGTGDEINGSEVDENGFTVADILDGTTSTDLAGAGVVDFVFTTSRSGLRLIDLDNAASAVHTALTVEWDPGDGGNLTDNGSGIGIDFIMPDDADNQDTYASINTMVVSDATTAEEGELSFKVVKAGTNTEVLTIGSGVSTFSQKITVGVDDTGHDVKFFGASAGAYMEWDESADQLRIMGASADATTSTGKLLLATSLTDINANDVLGKIDFQAPHETGTDAITVAASIQAIAQGTFSASVNATDLVFYTGHSEAATEKFRFTSQGEIGIGGANYGTDGQVLTSTGAGTAPAWEDSGDFSGPGSATDNAIIRFDGTGGKTGQNSGVTIDDSNNVTGFGTLASGAATLASLVCTAGATFGGGYGSAGTTIDTDGVIQTNGAVTLGSTLAAGATTITGDTIIAEGYGLVIGHSAQLNTVGYPPELQVLGTGDADSQISLGRWSANSTGSHLSFIKSRHASIGSSTIVNDDDQVGIISWQADDGTTTDSRLASIEAYIDGTPGVNDMPGRLVFRTTADGASMDTERMRIISSGEVGIGVTPAATRKLDVGSSAQSDQISFAKATHASFDQQVISAASTRTASADFNMFWAGANNQADVVFKVTGAGVVTADGSFTGSGADYQEYFESTNGTALEIGKAVVLAGDKVRIYDSTTDAADDIVGVTRPKADNKNSAMCGNAAWNRWTDMYITDDWGVYEREDATIWQWDAIQAVDATEDTEAVEGREAGSAYEHNELALDADWTPPEGAVSSIDSIRKLNPAYRGPTDRVDPDYVPRHDRNEWNLIGLLGQVQIKASEATNPRWIKMKDISDAVELWHIR